MNQAIVELSAKDLDGNGGVHCPSAQAHMARWNSHPRVFLEIAHQGQAQCPYCGTVYRLKAGEVIRAGH